MDVADATLRIARSSPTGECYHLSTPQNITIRQLVEMICRKLGADFDQVVQVTDDRPGKDAAYLLDSAKARETLGCQDRHSLEDGLAETVCWGVEHFGQLRLKQLDYYHNP